MFQINEFTETRLATITSRSEKHGDDEKPAVSLGLELIVANTVLDQIDPKLREALYKSVDDQEQLPGVEPATPVLRCNSVDRVLLPTKHEGWVLTIDDNIDENEPMKFGGCKVDKFSVEPKQGGSIVLRLRVGTSDLDAARSGFLGMHVGQPVWIMLLPPEKPADAIDGSTDAFKKDHPDAGDLFAAGQGDPGGEPDVEVGGDDEGAPQDLEDRLEGAFRKADDEASGGGPQLDGSWPFPDKGNNSMEAPPQSVTTEVTTRSPAGSRTARGRAATAKALAAGAPKA